MEGGALPVASPPRRICFVTDEIHPSTTGGCGVLLHHAAELLREAGHTVVFLLDVPHEAWRRFQDTDRHALAGGAPPPAYHVEALCEDLALREDETLGPFQRTSLRVDHALQKVLAREDLDLVEFIEYRGLAYHALVRKLFGLQDHRATLALRVHNSMELIDAHEATRALTLERYLLHAAERGALGLAETVLAPTPAYAEAYCRRVYGVAPARTVVSQSPRRPFPAVDRRDPTRRREIVCHGRVFQFKGVDRLVQAACLLLEQRPELDVDFVFLGEDSRDTPVGGSHTAYLQRQIPPRWQQRFVFPGQLTHEQVAERLSRALFGVFPNEFESFCYALHELYHAAVPVIVNDLPGFADFFTHERNALVYDGSVAGLVTAMQRMLDEPELRERLSLPYPVAGAPLGDYYGAPYATQPLARDAALPEVLTLVLARRGTEIESDRWRSLEAGGAPSTSVVLLREAEAGDAGCLPFLGSLWRAEDVHGRAIPAGQIVTRQALWILEAGDRPDARCLPLLTRALSRRPQLGFAGCWWRSGGRIVPSALDLAPELWPFQEGARRTRVLLRTAPGLTLGDVFDARLGPLGEIGCLWSTVERQGPGALWSEPLVEVPPADPVPADPGLLSFLVASQRGTDRWRRLARLGVVLDVDATARGGSERLARRLAREHLSARTLWKLAWTRMRSR